MTIKIDYEPEVVKKGKTRMERVEDGDTVFIQEGIRMLGLDAPEIHYPGNTHPARHDELLEKLSKKLTKLGVKPGLAKHLKSRLRKKAGTRHGTMGDQATSALEGMVRERLKRVSKTGKVLTPRGIYIQVSSEVFDRYGRLLAYVAPDYTRSERRKIVPQKRPTFNLQMLQEGWATTILIYPNIPKKKDLRLIRRVVASARKKGWGMWSDKKLLLGYEFRACIRLAKGDKNWLTRHCVDMTTARVYEPLDYYRVAPEDRIFVFPEHLEEAVEALGLIWTSE